MTDAMNAIVETIAIMGTALFHSGIKYIIKNTVQLFQFKKKHNLF